MAGTKPRPSPWISNNVVFKPDIPPYQISQAELYMTLWGKLRPAFSTVISCGAKINYVGGHPTRIRRSPHKQHIPPQLRLLAPKGNVLPFHPKTTVRYRLQNNIQDQQPTEGPGQANGVNLQQSATSPLSLLAMNLRHLPSPDLAVRSQVSTEYKIRQSLHIQILIPTRHP